ncbi:TPA: hypothetical protein ACHU7J_001214, partial [Streptococcus suis]
RFANTSYNTSVDRDFSLPIFFKKSRYKCFFLVSALTILFSLCYNKLWLIKQDPLVLIGGVGIPVPAPFLIFDTIIIAYYL